MRKFTGLTTAAAIVVTTVGLSATPAEARHRHGGWGYRHHDRVDAGDVIGGLLVIGTIAAIASAASKDKAERRSDRYEPPYRGEEDRDARDYNSRDNDDDAAYGARADDDAADTGTAYDEEGSAGDDENAAASGDSGFSEVRPYGTGADEQRAADACGWAVESEMGRDSRIDSSKAEPNNGGWYVTGTASRLGGEVKSFGCSYQNGRVADVRFGE